MLTRKTVVAFLLIVALALILIAPTLAFSRQPDSPTTTSIIIPPGGSIEIALLNSTVISQAADMPLAVALEIADYGSIYGFSIKRICSIPAAAIRPVRLPFLLLSPTPNMAA